MTQQQRSINITFPNNNMKVKYDESKIYINNTIDSFKSNNQNFSKELFISKQDLGFYSNIPKILKGFRWNGVKNIGIDNTELYEFRSLRNMIAHHENLIKCNKKLNSGKVFLRKNQTNLIIKLKYVIKTMWI